MNLRPFAFELQSATGHVREPILNIDIVAECQARNLACANGEDLIGVFLAPSGIFRMVLARFT